MKAGKYAHLFFVDDIEEAERKSPQNGPPQVTVDPLIEGRTRAEVAVDPL